ncbi:protein-disulfide reductase DsbD domain-containing protein [Roseovarius sp. E0-M6]|uniref:protein-disulfide reductase DsbD domain-containing protein n=1 Tax=Roseovarius sp. E0-M6 TaxID=3127118 RepID=UPI00300F8361
MTRCILAFLLTLFVALPLRAGEYVVEARILPGWRMADGTHMAGLLLTLDPGWKTYWRAPGDAGIPPQFDWRGSRNLSGVHTLWPRPRVLDQGGVRTIGYKDQVILPLAVKPSKTRGDVTLDGMLDMGVCSDVCVPVSLRVQGRLSASVTRPDPAIAAALAARPHSAHEAGVSGVTCRIEPAKNGLTVTARITMPATGGSEVVVIETANPEIWVAPAKTARDGDLLTARSFLAHVSGRPFAVNRSGLRFTVLGTNRAVDIKGCTHG